MSSYMLLRAAAVSACVLAGSCGSTDQDSGFDVSSDVQEAPAQATPAPSGPSRSLERYDVEFASRVTSAAYPSYTAVPLWAQARARCSATQGLWHAALATCTCTAGQIFSAPNGCISALPLRPPMASCIGRWSELPTLCLKELASPGLSVRLNWGTAKRPRRAFLAHMDADWTRWFGGALAVPTAPGTLHLVNSQLFKAAVAAWLDFDASERIVMAAPYAPRAALHEGEGVNIVPACALALKNAGIPLDAHAQLCEGVATTVAAIRVPNAPSAAVLRSITVRENTQADIGLVQARYSWDGVQSTYRIPWQHAISPSRHVVTEGAQGERVVAFLSPTGTVHAWAVQAANAQQPTFFDDMGKVVR